VAFLMRHYYTDN